MNQVNPKLKHGDLSQKEIETITDYLQAKKFTVRTYEDLYSMLDETHPLSIIIAKTNEIRQQVPHKKHKIKSLDRYEEDDDPSLEAFMGSASSALEIEWGALPKNLKNKYTTDVIKERIDLLLKQKESDPYLSDTEDLPLESSLKRKGVYAEAYSFRHKRIFNLESTFDVSTEGSNPSEEKIPEKDFESDSDTSFDSSQTLKN